MNELYPIIRRKRRPLVVADAPTSGLGHGEPEKIAQAKTGGKPVKVVPQNERNGKGKPESDE